MLEESFQPKSYDHGTTPDVPSKGRTEPLVALGRSLLKRCPRCGQGRLFTRWFDLPPRCPRCRLSFDRGDGFWLGSMAINLGVTELVFGIFALVWMIVTWPHVPWALVTAFAVALNVAVPILFYPWAKTTFLAFDLMLHQVDNVNAEELELIEADSEARQAAEANVAAALEDAVSDARNPGARASGQGRPRSGARAPRPPRST